MTTVTADRTLAEVVTADPAATRVSEAYALDYCCGGRRRIDEACATAGVDLDAVLEALGDLGPAPAVDWASMGPAALVDHLEATHHAYLREELRQRIASGELRPVNPFISSRCFVGMVMDCALNVELWNNLESTAYSADAVIQNNVPVFARGPRADGAPRADA